MVNPKRKKACKAVEMRNDNMEEDRISCFGDTLLSHILSSLHTKEAVRTSVLSKRWKHVWTEIPVINLSPIFRKIEEKDRFARFFTRVLDLNKVSHLEKFCFDDLLCFDIAQINAWTEKLGKRRIDEIDLSHPFGYTNLQAHIQLLVDFLTRVQHGILSLRLHGCLFRTGFTITSTEFSNLKTLDLWLVKTPCSASMNRLLACCPVLERLLLSSCDWDHIHIESYTLKYLTLDYCGNNLFIKAPNLEDFSFRCHRNRHLGDYYPMEGLLKAKLGFGNTPSLALLQAISYVKILILGSARLNECVRKAISCNQLTFKSLTSLEFSGYEGSIQYMIAMLKCCPNLETFIFRKRISCANELRFSRRAEYVRWISPVDVPECLLSCLKTVEIIGFCRECEDCFCMIRYFLKSASVLREIKLTTDIKDSEKDISILKDLLMVPRGGSTSCQVIFINR